MKKLFTSLGMFISLSLIAVGIMLNYSLSLGECLITAGITLFLLVIINVVIINA